MLLFTENKNTARNDSCKYNCSLEFKHFVLQRHGKYCIVIFLDNFIFKPRSQFINPLPPSPQNSCGWNTSQYFLSCSYCNSNRNSKYKLYIKVRDSPLWKMQSPLSLFFPCLQAAACPAGNFQNNYHWAKMLSTADTASDSSILLVRPQRLQTRRSLCSENWFAFK